LKFSSYLQSFSINVQINDIARASVSFVCYLSGSGFLGNKRKTINYNKDTNTVVNGWSSFITSSGTFLNIPTYDFSYNFQANYSPVYIIGKLIPNQIMLLNGTEEISFTRDSNIEISFSGEKVSKHLIDQNTEKNILLHALRYDWDTDSPNPLSFDIRDFQINSREITIEENNFVRTKIGIQQSF
ncbi:MAG: hypothetical protein AABY22_11235, partial [Nanoarchaeota archaeon]